MKFYRKVTKKEDSVWQQNGLENVRSFKIVRVRSVNWVKLVAIVTLYQTCLITFYENFQY